MSQANVAHIPPDQFDKGPVQTGNPDLSKICEQLTLERDQLRQKLTEVTEERDAYLQACYALLPPIELSYTKEELLSLVDRERSFEDLINELEKEHAKGDG